MGSKQYFKITRRLKSPFLVSPRLQELESRFYANGGWFKKFKIGELFKISTGSLLTSQELTQGKIPRISAKSDNNGILGYYDTLDNSNARHCKNFISVNFFGNAFYHPYLASLEMKVHILKLKNYEFTKESGLFITSVINRIFANKFSYGNQLSSSKLRDENYIISLPVHKNGEIAFDFMESYIKELEYDRLKKLNEYLEITGLKDYTLTESEINAINIFNTLDSKTNGGGVKAA